MLRISCTVDLPSGTCRSPVVLVPFQSEILGNIFCSLSLEKFWYNNMAPMAVFAKGVPLSKTAIGACLFFGFFIVLISYYESNIVEILLFSFE